MVVGVEAVWVRSILSFFGSMPARRLTRQSTGTIAITTSLVDTGPKNLDRYFDECCVLASCALRFSSPKGLKLRVHRRTALAVKVDSAHCALALSAPAASALNDCESFGNVSAAAAAAAAVGDLRTLPRMTDCLSTLVASHPNDDSYAPTTLIAQRFCAVLTDRPYRRQLAF